MSDNNDSSSAPTWMDKAREFFKSKSEQDEDKKKKKKKSPLGYETDGQPSIDINYDTGMGKFSK